MSTQPTPAYQAFAEHICELQRDIPVPDTSIKPWELCAWPTCDTEGCQIDHNYISTLDKNFRRAVRDEKARALLAKSQVIRDIQANHPETPVWGRCGSFKEG
jgi:hypothetical protein